MRRPKYQPYYILNHPTLTGAPAEFVARGDGGCTLRLLVKWGKHPKGEEVWVTSDQFTTPQSPPSKFTPAAEVPGGGLPAPAFTHPASSAPVDPTAEQILTGKLYDYRYSHLEIKCGCGREHRLQTDRLPVWQCWMPIGELIGRLRCRRCGGQPAEVWACCPRWSVLVWPRGN